MIKTILEMPTQEQSMTMTAIIGQNWQVGEIELAANKGAGGCGTCGCAVECIGVY